MIPSVCDRIGFVSDNFQAATRAHSPVEEISGLLSGGGVCNAKFGWSINYNVGLCIKLRSTRKNEGGKLRKGSRSL